MDSPVNKCDYYNDPEFSYKDYWNNRGYEDLAERQILKCFISRISKLNILVDIGVGYGRLLDVYKDKYKIGIMIEPSDKNIFGGQEAFSKYKNINVVKAIGENIPIKSNTVDAAFMIRVSHHCLDFEKTICNVHKILVNDGWFVLEFPNKINILNSIKYFLRGSFDFRFQYSSIDIGKKKSSNFPKVPFRNYHPLNVIQLLRKNGFEIKDCVSVSNLRRINFLPIRLALYFDRLLWKLSNPIWWGPSIFILAKKKSSL